MKKLLFFLLLGTSSLIFAEVSSFAWDTSLITTNIEHEQGTGYDIWTSPEPIDSDGVEYYFTSKLHTVAYALVLTPQIDVGVLESSTNIGYPDSLPCVLGDEVISGTITDPMTVNYSYRLKSIIETDWKVKIELSEFKTDILGGARLEMIGNLSEGNGTFAHVVIPEPFLFINFYLLFIIYYFKNRQ